MNILIIGGTRFQGRHLVKELLDAGHTVTVFHRGSHVIEPRSGLTNLIGDRNESADLARLAGSQFDACVDTCAYFPAQIALLGDILKTRHYSLVSSVYVYADQDAVLTEDAPLLRMSDGPEPGLTPENYGALKALCENEAQARFGCGSLILRPSIIIGAGDHTERLLFWLRLVAVHGKRVDIVDFDPVIQLVDVRDLARFTAGCVATARRGAVNVCGTPVRLSALFDAIEATCGRTCERKHMRFADLPALGLGNLPYCEPGHLARHDTTRARAWGFINRKLQDSLTEICAHSRQQNFAMRGFHTEESTVLRLFA